MTNKPATDADQTKLPEIRHIFPGERKRISPIITILFIASVVVAIVGYIIYLG